MAAAAIDWSGLDRGVQAGFDRMRVVGAAVAVVSSAQILHTVILGSRTRVPRRPVTATTRFVVTSTTKALSSALVASYVDAGGVGWDQKAVDAWSGFRAPTDELTRSLTIRDLLGIATGIKAPDSTDFHLGAYTPAEMLQSLVNLPVTGPPRRSSFFHLNRVYAAGAFPATARLRGLARGPLPGIRRSDAHPDLRTRRHERRADRLRPARRVCRLRHSTGFGA